jgi:hypothetical protein
MQHCFRFVRKNGRWLLRGKIMPCALSADFVLDGTAVSCRWHVGGDECETTTNSTSRGRNTSA